MVGGEGQETAGVGEAIEMVGGETRKFSGTDVGTFIKRSWDEVLCVDGGKVILLGKITWWLETCWGSLFIIIGGMFITICGIAVRLGDGMCH